MTFPDFPVRLRRAGAADLGAVLNLFRETVTTVNARDYSPAQIEAWATGADFPERWQARINSQYFLLAEDPEIGLAGFGSLAADGYVDLLYVNAARQRCGIGSLLLGKLIHQAYQLGLTTLTSDVSHTAKPLFTALGFQTIRAQEKDVRGVTLTNFAMQRNLHPPVLSTERLLLKPFGPEDTWDFYLLNEDEEVVRHTGDRPFRDRQEAAAFLGNYDQYQRYGYGRWTVLRRSDGQYLGWCGLKYHPGQSETDLGFRLYRRYWGRGYATEAARACLTYGFEQLELPAIIGRVRQANGASIRVLEKCGMQRWKAFDFEGYPGWYYGLRRP